MVARILLALLLVAGLALAGIFAIGAGWVGSHEAPGTPTNVALPEPLVRERAAERRGAALDLGVSEPKQILFGDLHVHTTFSVDAFLISLPLLAGEGAHPPADACDFARYCSALDFWSINDHAEGITPRHWRETVEAIRQCNDVAGDPAEPDVVAFLGWEWTQVGRSPEDHFGHKNVVLAHTDDARIPPRPIASKGLTNAALRGPSTFRRGLVAAWLADRRSLDLAVFLGERSAASRCPDDVPTRELPDDCMESVRTPGELFERLAAWGHDSIVIPHGTTWGFYTPAGSSWDKQLSAAQHDPARQTLIEVHSGHGNSEQYRGFRAVRFDASGEPVCPEPTAEYLPSCWRAGEIIAARCAAAGESEEECAARAAEARRLYLEAGNAGHRTVQGVEMQEWLDSGQCRDCFHPAFNYRPMGSVQYILALRNFASGEPERFRFGFIASSDNHTARPGTGYKEVNRREMTEAAGPASERGMRALGRSSEEPLPRSTPFDLDAALSGSAPFSFVEAERQASFFLTGGLVATHSSGRDRGAIWEAFQRREVYGTSGPRILLWFDVLNAEGGERPMGSEVEVSGSPRFRVRAVGSFEQQPGCPDFATRALSPERLEHLCRGECYHPSDRRRRITRIEVVRIRPQIRPGEPVGPLIDDPWKVLPCPADPAGCEVEFEDPEHAASGRDALYYVRAIEEPSPAVNASNLRCRRDASGACLEARPCHGDLRTEYQDDCLATTEERAWSSPIHVAPARTSRAGPAAGKPGAAPAAGQRNPGPAAGSREAEAAAG